MSAARAVSKRSAVGRVAAAGVPSLAVAGVRAAAPAAPVSSRTQPERLGFPLGRGGSVAPGGGRQTPREPES